MPATRDLTTVLSAAETAAAAGDFATAATELREALAIQEGTLGPSHPDLADTLNNLGVASERATQLDDAERYYRRALAVAMAAFDPGHPFVATSLANLREFCETNGRPFEPPMPSASSPPRPAAAPSPPAGRSSMSPVIVGVILIAALVVLVIFLGGGPDATTAPDASTAAADTPAPAVQPPATPAPATRARARSAGSAGSGGFPAVVNPRLCRSLETGDGDWNCDRATSPVRAGTLIFLTRVRSDRNTTVQHRWYRGQELVRSVSLRIVASPTEGYRTYSRYFVTSGDAEWRVELRSADGALLHEEKFVVK